MSAATDFATGLDVCLAEPPASLRGARLGVLLNQASLDRGFRYAHLALAERVPGQVRAVFGPQHGLWGEQQDNMIETGHGKDPVLGVPSYSLYSETRRPTPAMLEGLDVLVVDLQDVGTRVYTFVWTVDLCLQACAEAGVSVLVLDRPNPVGGTVVEGPRLQPGYESFVGLRSIPMRHGLTVGELARWCNRTIGCALDVVPMRGWQRRSSWSDLGRPWVPTSPNLPRFEGVLAYPGQVLIEGTLLSEGRGTTTPFEVLGAPWLDPWALAADAGPIDGAVLRPYRFEPTFHKHAGQSCGGVFVHVTEPARYFAYHTTLRLLAAARAQDPARFAWRPPPYEYEDELWPIDILSGSPALRTALDGGAEPARLAELAAVDVAGWWSEVADCLLYAR